MKFVHKYFAFTLLYILVATIADGFRISHFTQLVESVGTEKYILLLLSRLGLTNRLRAISDWYSVASQSSRTLVVSWERTNDCGTLFTELFEPSSVELLVLTNHLPQDAEGIALAASVLNGFNVSFSVYGEDDIRLWAYGHKSFVLSKNVVFSDAQFVITNYNGVLSLEGVNCKTYLQMHSSFLTSLVPKTTMVDLLNTMRAQHFSDKVMVGVHYRAHDNLQDWAVVPPLIGSPSDSNFGEGATVDHFIQVMRAVEASQQFVDADGRTATKVRFFVASNNEEAKQEFSRTFPTAIYLVGDHSRDNKEGMELAGLEWLALAQCDFIVHTYGSTFAEHAAHMHLTPIVGIWEGRLMHHSSIDLPFCGNLNYASEYNKAMAVKSSYRVNLEEKQVIRISVSSNAFLICV